MSFFNIKFFAFSKQSESNECAPTAPRLRRNPTAGDIRTVQENFTNLQKAINEKEVPDEFKKYFIDGFKEIWDLDNSNHQDPEEDVQRVIDYTKETIDLYK